MIKKSARLQAESHIPVKPIPKKRTVPEEIIKQIKSLIDSGHLVPGSKLPAERELAQMMKVSRPSLREALGALSFLGVVENRPGSGTSLTDSFQRWPSEPFSILFLLNKSALLEIFNARKTMEGPVAALAADHRNEDDLKAMEIGLKGMKKDLHHIEKYLKHELHFHRAIIEAAGNRIIADLMEKLYRLLRETRISIYHQYASTLALFQEQDYRNHELIFESIKAGDAQAATRAMMNHLLDFENWLNCQNDAEPRNRMTKDV
jgi:GntR family transcriptional regulator, transcriptional repressor for pyruvate dehydrogenase complex